jgi:hypothetical protein
MTQRMCKSCGNWHDLDKPWPEVCVWEYSARHAKKLGNAPYVISDEMRAAKHHATGRIITSKREFSRETRAAGCIELGNEPIRPRKPILLDKGQRREAIRKTIYDLRNGRA